MTDLNHFRVVLRGYDPAQVDRRVRVLWCGECAVGGRGWA